MLNIKRIQFFIIYMVVQLWAVTADKFSQNTSVENVLRKHIFNEYDKAVIPKTYGSPLRVYMNLMINEAELDYEKSQMMINTWLMAQWVDYRLAWNPSEYQNLHSIIVGYGEIWHPDIMAFNSVDANMEDDRTRANSLLGSDGLLMWMEPVRYVIHCGTDMTYWPYDEHTAFLKIGSWMYVGNLLNLTVIKSGINNLANAHSEWGITDVDQKRYVEYTPCCPTEENINVVYNITIKRKVHPYQSVIYIPALCSATFHLITFWLPYSDNNYKLFANLLNALFVTLTILVIYSKVPIVTSTVPLIVVYYTYSLGLIAISVVMFTIVRGVSATSTPLSQKVAQFLQSGYLVYFGIERNGPMTTDCHALCESEETNEEMAGLNDRRKLAKIIDRMCFVVFAFIYLILLLRLLP